MARGTIMTALFPEWATIERQNYLLIAMIGVAILSMVILELLKKCMNLPAVAVVGCAATLATQLVLMLEFKAGPYIAIWHCGKLFGFLSTFASGYIIQEVAPKEKLGYWNGRNEALTNLATAITPLVFAAIYDEVGNVRGVEMLAATSAISFLAMCAYIPMVKMMPARPAAPGSVKLQEMEHYEKMSDLEYCQLPLEVVNELNEKWLAAGKAPRLVTWGVYAEERKHLTQIHDNALNDFKWLNKEMIYMLSNRDAMVQEQQNMKQYEGLVPKVDREKAKLEMGSWIADYFDDAGYLDWETQSRIFKGMLMSAFPPIDALDEEKPDFATMPVKVFEHHVTKFLRVMDNHLAIEERRIKPKISTGDL